MSDEITGESVAGAESVGEVESSPVGDVTEAGVAEAKPFFEFKDPDSGEVLHSYKSAGELADTFRNDVWFRKNYETESKKVQERAKYLEDQIKKYEAQEKMLAESDYAKLTRWADANPRKWQQLQEAWKADTAPQRDPQEAVMKAVEEKYGPKLKEFEDWQTKQQEQIENERIVKSLQGKYPNLDPTLFDRELDKLQEVPEELRKEAFYEILYLANQARSAPPAQTPTKPSVTGSGVSPSNGVDVSKLSAAQIREMAESDLAKMGVGNDEE